MTAAQLDSLKKIISENAILTDDESLQKYGQDWTRYYTPNPQAILFPRTTEEVQKIVRWANENQQKLVVSGGRTGLSGGAVAMKNEIVISLEKMNQIYELNPIDLTLRVQAGVITEALQNYLKERHYLFPVDFAARGSSHIGGNIATNAGGIKVLRYGLMRDWVASLTVVTGEGEILNLNKSLIKNATGFDLRQMFIGNEGTLGIVTEAEIKFTNEHGPLQSLLVAVPDLASVMKIFSEFRKKTSLMAFEMFTDLALRYVMKSTQLPKPVETEAPIYLLIEFEHVHESAEEKALETFEYCMEQGWILDGVMSQNDQQMKNFWRYREDITESLAFATPYKNDISVRISKVPEFMQEIDEIYRKEYPDFEVVWFGHIGDGNLHISILKPKDMKMEDFVIKCRQSDKHLFNTIQKFQGSISAEHGVGLSKKSYLSYTKSPQEIEYMKAIKKIMDPNLVLNPGKVFDI